MLQLRQLIDQEVSCRTQCLKDVSLYSDTKRPQHSCTFDDSRQYRRLENQLNESRNPKHYLLSESSGFHSSRERRACIPQPCNPKSS